MTEIGVHGRKNNGDDRCWLLRNVGTLDLAV